MADDADSAPVDLPRLVHPSGLNDSDPEFMALVDACIQDALDNAIVINGQPTLSPHERSELRCRAMLLKRLAELW